MKATCQLARAGAPDQCRIGMGLCFCKEHNSTLYIAAPNATDEDLDREVKRNLGGEEMLDADQRRATPLELKAQGSAIGRKGVV